MNNIPYVYDSKFLSVCPLLYSSAFFVDPFQVFNLSPKSRTIPLLLCAHFKLLCASSSRKCPILSARSCYAFRKAVLIINTNFKINRLPYVPVGISSGYGNHDSLISSINTFREDISTIHDDHVLKRIGKFYKF